MFAGMKRLLAGVLLTLALPAAAQADTTTVDPASSGTCVRAGTCKTIGDAIGVSQATDVVKVLAGTYAESVTIPAALDNVTVEGAPGANIDGGFSIAGENVKLKGLTILRQTGTAAAVAGTGGLLEISDSLVGSFVGPAVTLGAGAENKVLRSTVASLEPAAETSDGINLNVTGSGDRILTVESSIVIGGAKSAAFRVTTAASSGNATLNLNHVTSTGVNAIVLNGAGGSLPVSAPGDITAVVKSSIIHGASTATGFEGVPNPVPALPPLVAANKVESTYTHSDASPVTDAGGATSTGDGTFTPDSALFGSGFRLRADATAAIDKGGPLAAGESDKDIDGDPRVAGPASDIGADEFVNSAPELSLELSPTTAKTGQVVTATGKATDKQGNSDIVGYGTDWGDGKKDTSASNVVQHVYEKSGTYTVQMVVADKSNAFSAIVSKSITITDGSPPQLQITTPAEGASVKLTTKKPKKKGKKRKKKALTIKGVDADESGIAKVEVAITRRAGSSCQHYNGSKFVSGSCSNPTFVNATLSGNGFKVVTKKLIFKKGTYEARARATDTKGNAGPATFEKSVKTLVSFKVK